MANAIEKLNTIAIGDIEKVNTLTDANIEKLNTLEFTSVDLIVAASGGNTTATDGNYKVHTFTSSGTFSVSDGGQVSILVIAGGGGGGGVFVASGISGGGGGAGGMLINTEYTTADSTDYTVTVGAGGAGGVQASQATRGVKGSNSVFGDQTAILLIHICALVFNLKNT